LSPAVEKGVAVTLGPDMSDPGGATVETFGVATTDSLLINASPAETAVRSAVGTGAAPVSTADVGVVLLGNGVAGLAPRSLSFALSRS
jgi:hypothetical protein